MSDHATAIDAIAFDNRYAQLPAQLWSRSRPAAVSAPRLLRLNDSLARSLGLDAAVLTSVEGVEMLAGNRVPASAEPLSMAYAGHQFGAWVPQLGDGRAILLGELIDRQGVRQDIQLKGAGRTVWSRGGDGRAGIGPVLREYLVSEAMAALGVPTTRALAAVATGETVMRERPLPGAVLVRVASSHIRIGTFQYFAARQDREALGALLDHVVERHYPEARDTASPALAVLEAVMARQADLVSQWLGLGFIHGVMNTDNTSVAGLTIDYGPCAFIDEFVPDKVFSSIDVAGRYAYRNQPTVLHWNLANLAQCLLPLIDDDADRALEQARAAVDAWPSLQQTRWQHVLREKIGLGGVADADRPEADAIGSTLLETMAAAGADFTETFRRLGYVSRETTATDAGAEDAFLAAFGKHTALATEWLASWRYRLAQSGIADDTRSTRMASINPSVIPRNHRIEAAIKAAMASELQPFHDLADELAQPFAERPDDHWLRQPPTADEAVTRTFCGT